MPPNLWCRQCRSKRAVSGVTCHWLGLGKDRQESTFWRTRGMMDVGSYCCAAVESPLPSSNTKPGCAALALRFFGLGIGVMNFALRRCGVIFCVGWPSSSSSQCRDGYS